MKTGPIIAVASAAVLTTLLFIAPRTPQTVEVAQEEEAVHDHSHEGMSPLDAKVAQAVEIIQSQEQPPMVAVGMLREVLEEDPQHIGALMTLGDLSVMSNQLDRAEGRYITILAIEPDNFEALEKLLQVYDATGKVDQAKGAIQEFLEKNERHPERAELEERLSLLQEK
ncbi:MAG: tetratricopeptide repeat protein [Bacteroidetes bacterium]|uniref:Tetratricopeptide repeat protein n=1 Tax=Phaeocystidibacter marisrubri TaxID=1577780 RepID=A0A6L3ZDG3_9FLAO|nr:tetratricopeptide repeat protein [Phaeocystidibacter marisrubri]KAB2815885.1 tetratricopeptide repeat protein [Phaeocystidibacter marisrubri]TNE30729.1 MAG: tetratricopeptide repeat protein [Bacteroidota bacterium]GGH66223.1 hypothetical protein GCM10011318_03960 [Phaeocystidibacter marisrubri]